MELSYQAAEKIAADHFGVPCPLQALGWGIGGFVFLSPDSRTAVKVHRSDIGFVRELEVYRILRRLGITQVHGLSVPRLRGMVRATRIIQMDCVSKPYLLDFAGVRFAPPDFPPETMQMWHDGIARPYGPNAHIAYSVYHTLESRGLWYMDIRPSNLNVEGHPDFEPYDATAEDDSW